MGRSCADAVKASVSRRLSAVGATSTLARAWRPFDTTSPRVLVAPPRAFFLAELLVDPLWLVPLPVCEVCEEVLDRLLDVCAAALAVVFFLVDVCAWATPVFASAASSPSVTNLMPHFILLASSFVSLDFKAQKPIVPLRLEAARTM